MEGRIEKLERDVAHLKKKYSELLRLNIESSEFLLKNIYSLKERLDNNKFLNEEQLRIMVETLQMVEDLEPPLQKGRKCKR